jgi:hypothetical protein
MFQRPRCPDFKEEEEEAAEARAAQKSISSRSKRETK